MTFNTGRVLVAGESWSSYGIHVKGASAYTTARYEEGADELIGALEAGGNQVTYLPNHRAVEEFPSSVDELRDQYDAIVLSDIPSDALLLPRAVFIEGNRAGNRLQALRQFVEAGGGLLMIGGYMSFAGFEAKARYGSTPLDEVLPVASLNYDDRVELPEGFTPRIGNEHEVLAGLPREWPYFLGYNRTLLRTDSEVVLWAGEDPLLALASRGSGRVGAFTSDCAPHWGSPEFMNWDGYDQFWSNLIGWLIS